jgi:hypothetical protein
MIRVLYPGSGLFIPDPDPVFLHISDPGVKRAPDPGSTTLLMRIRKIGIGIHIPPHAVNLTVCVLQPVRARHAREAEARAAEPRGAAGRCRRSASGGAAARTGHRRAESAAHQDIYEGARNHPGGEGGTGRSPA